tara:strand:- start:1592 stop:2470 length:879 start_codon:yes stop_codon:yes gene_type:complete
MYNRWHSIVEDINFFFMKVNILIKKTRNKLRKPRGRPPKHDPEKYLQLIAAKEFDRKSLRGAEVRLSKEICKERVDHSVIAYWEKKPEVTEVFSDAIKEAGKELDAKLSQQFTVIDATSFTSWFKEDMIFHLFNRISEETVYPIGISFLTGSVKAPVSEAIDPGSGKLYADAGYDDNASIGVMFEKGYEPIVCPNSTRWKGYHRKKARKLYNKFENRLGYRQRGRGESVFGSLTNYFGDRFKTINIQVTQTRTAVRVLVYQVKLLMRLTQEFLGIVRHALIRETPDFNMIIS